MKSTTLGISNTHQNVSIGGGGKLVLRSSNINNSLGWGVVALTSYGAQIKVDVETVNTNNQVPLRKVMLSTRQYYIITVICIKR